MQSEFTTISAIARRLGIAPRAISDRFYSRKFDESICPLIRGRRSIPENYVPTIERMLFEDGVLAGAAQRSMETAGV